MAETTVTKALSPSDVLDDWLMVWRSFALNNSNVTENNFFRGSSFSLFSLNSVNKFLYLGLVKFTRSREEAHDAFRTIDCLLRF